MILNATIGSTTYILGVLRDSYSFTKRCGDAGRHSISSVKCSVRPTDDEGNNFGAAIFQADGLVPATLSNGGTTVFTGYIRPYTSTSARNTHSGDIELEIMDPTESMHEYVWPVSEEGVAIKETIYQGKTLKENITTLFGLVGKTCDTSGLGDYLMPWLRLSEGEYIDEVIAQMLFEFGYDYMWTSDGVATFFSTFKPSSVTRKISDIRNTLTTSRSDDRSDGLKITYSIYREAQNVQIYNHSHHYSFEWWKIFSDGTLIAGLTGKYWNGFMHDSKFTNDGNASKPLPAEKFMHWDFSKTGLVDAEGEAIKDSDVYYVSIDPSSQVKVWLDDENGVNLTPHLDEYDATGARFWVDYSGTFNVQWTWRIEIYGKVGYRVDSEVSFNKVGPNPETLNLRYRLMLDGTVDQDVQAFASKYAERKKASAITYGFDSLTEYDVGGFYVLENTVGGSSQIVRIISRTMDEDGIYSYKVEGASTVDDISVTTTYEANAPSSTDVSKQNIDLTYGGSLVTDTVIIGQKAPRDKMSTSWEHSWLLGDVPALIMKVAMIATAPYGCRFEGQVTAEDASITDGYFTVKDGDSVEFINSTFTHRIEFFRDEKVSIDGGTPSSFGTASVDITNVDESTFMCAEKVAPTGLLKSLTQEASFVGLYGNPYTYGYFGKINAMDIVIDSRGVSDNYKNQDEGSVRLPTGVIMKWRKFTKYGDSSARERRWTFAAPFTGNCVYAFAAQLSPYASGGDKFYGYPISISSESVSFSMWGQYDYYCVALGYAEAGEIEL